MNTDIIEKPKNLPAPHEVEANNILTASQEDCGFEKLLKFKKGKYFVQDDEVPLGTQYVAHTNQWTYCWIKFTEDKVVDRHMVKVAEGGALPEREALDDNDPSSWKLGLDGKPKDPWSLQYLLPLENLENGEVVIFTTASVGGKMGVAEPCRAWARRAKNGSRALPIVKLSSAEMQTKKFGAVPRPLFEITDWDETPASGVEAIPSNAADELNDEIPY
jgi:hypothetical protein